MTEKRAEPSAWTAPRAVKPGPVATTSALAVPQKPAGSTRRAAAMPSGSGPSLTDTSVVRPLSRAGGAIVPGGITTPDRASTITAASAAAWALSSSAPGQQAMGEGPISGAGAGPKVTRN